jgi:hypothetical protein
MYLGYEITRRSIVGGKNISKDGEFVDFVYGDAEDARNLVDALLEEQEADAC